MANLITGDAITLDLRIAGLPSRSLALAVDVTIQVGLLMTGTVLASWVFSAGGSPGAQAAVTLAVVVLALVAWPTMLETLTRGRSLGKVMMGLRVVRDDGGPIRMRHSLVRALAMVFLDLWVTSGVVGGLSALTSSKSKRMGDHLAGTIVVGERIPRHATAHQEIAMPPQLAGWAAGLDLVAVPDGLALNVRTFLHRAPSLDPAVRVTHRRAAGHPAGRLRADPRAGRHAGGGLPRRRPRRAHPARLGGGPAAPWDNGPRSPGRRRPPWPPRPAAVPADGAVHRGQSAHRAAPQTPPPPDRNPHWAASARIRPRRRPGWAPQGQEARRTRHPQHPAGPPMAGGDRGSPSAGAPHRARPRSRSGTGATSSASDPAPGPQTPTARRWWVVAAWRSNNPPPSW